MALLIGFTWAIGFLLWNADAAKAAVPQLGALYETLTYAFILLNASPGVFIFVAFLGRRDTWTLYVKLIESRCRGRGRRRTTTTLPQLPPLPRQRQMPKPRVELTNSATTVFSVDSSSMAASAINSSPASANATTGASAAATRRANDGADAACVDFYLTEF